jgi:hypothetical protein
MDARDRLNDDEIYWGRLNAAETEAVQTLQRLARRWPSSLWLFSASGTLWVMKKNSKGQRVSRDVGGYDERRVVGKFPIENDGGDW